MLSLFYHLFDATRCALHDTVSPLQAAPPSVCPVWAPAAVDTEQCTAHAMRCAK